MTHFLALTCAFLAGVAIAPVIEHAVARFAARLAIRRDLDNWE